MNNNNKLPDLLRREWNLLASGGSARVHSPGDPGPVPGTGRHQLFVELVLGVTEVTIGSAGVEDLGVVGEVPAPFPGTSHGFGGRGGTVHS